MSKDLVHKKEEIKCKKKNNKTEQNTTNFDVVPKGNRKEHNPN